MQSTFLLLLLFSASALTHVVDCWSAPSSMVRRSRLSATGSKTSSDEHSKQMQVSKILAGSLLAGSLLVNQPPPAQAYTSEPVRQALESLSSTRGNSETTLQTYQGIADMITEGKGIGGDVNYKGVQLDRGYVADEDTSIYNPGLTLLTETEKTQLVQSLVESRKANIEAGVWDKDGQLGFEFLRTSLDPYHMYELKGYLGIVPFYSAAIYLAVLAVQQLARPGFPAAYFVGVAAIALPALVLILLGPN